MKFSCFTPLPGGYAFLRHLLPTLVAGGICLSSCEDDMDRPSLSSHVSFTSEISSTWTPATRSTANVGTPQGTVTALQGGSTPLYLHTLYTDSIASPSSDVCPDTAVLTRATPVKDDNMYGSFGVSAYSYTGSWSESRTPDYFYNATASKSGSGDYALASTYYWPGASYKMKFFAYAPKDNGQYVLSGSTHPGSPTIGVTIPSDVNDQEDLLVAQTAELAGNTNTAVALTFNHALTAVRFVCGNDMQDGTVKSVSLKNVYSKGTYNMGTQTWSDVDTPADFSQTLDKSTTGTPNEALTTDAQTFMMIPQTLPDGAQIEVVFTDYAGTDHTLTADIKGTEWPIGKTVTYKISSSSINWKYTIKINMPNEFTYTGGTLQYSVVLYKENGLGEKQSVPWTAEFSEDDGVSWKNTPPDWVTGFTTAGPGGETPQSYTATVSAQIGTDNSPHTTALQSAIEKGTETAPYNLANQTGSSTVQNTANCYVVSAPGYYCFPLVYGNAIKNGTTNTSAYTSNKTGSNILKTFINHTGDPITSPYIKNNNCQPSKAELVWQDAPGLVTDIKYEDTGNGRIAFKVDKNTIRQGNAVIAIKDANGTVLWSWHIWVTDENIGQTIEVTNHQGKKYKLMSVNLGWCEGRTETYAERMKYWIRFQSIDPDGIMHQRRLIIQPSASITTGGNHPYYQWGRKDPFPPSNGLANTNKIWYDKDGNAHTESPQTENLSTGIACIKNYILKPDVMHSQYSGDNTYANLWSADNNVYTANDENVIKTIYDPSPVGFKLPPSNAFTGFTTTGNYTNNTSQINGEWNGSLKGWNFYADSSKSKTLFFPALGMRFYSKGGMGNVGSYGGCWSAVPYSQTNGRFLYFYSSSIGSLGNYDRMYGFGVRSSQDE
ncbi:fimbrillin family protein [Parabacteroides merdae]|uniref:fimbrillin family protein n=1 Tax=Parabacteroides merdae TaxID=46503 RepID=UPI0022E2C94A|nr:fimbrillin family protein [Parabacteroides merdae]